MLTYNRKVINDLFSSFSEIVKTNISIYDNNLQWPDIQNATNHSLCQYLNPIIQSKCANSDYCALQRAINSEEPFFYNCHFGYIEIMVPCRIDPETKIYVVVGPFRDPNTEDEMKNKIVEMCKAFNKDESSALSKFLATPLFDETTYNSITHIVKVFIEYAQTIHLISIQDNFVSAELNTYIQKNLDRDVKTSEICSKFYYTSKQLEYIVKKHTGMTPKKYIDYYKMNVAKNKLISTSESLQDIANDVGYSNYNYFIKVYKKFFKLSPLQYRIKYQNSSFVKE